MIIGLIVILAQSLIDHSNIYYSTLSQEIEQEIISERGMKQKFLFLINGFSARY